MNERKLPIATIYRPGLTFPKLTSKVSLFSQPVFMPHPNKKINDVGLWELYANPALQKTRPLDNVSNTSSDNSDTPLPSLTTSASDIQVGLVGGKCVKVEPLDDGYARYVYKIEVNDEWSPEVQLDKIDHHLQQINVQSEPVNENSHVSHKPNKRRVLSQCNSKKKKKKGWKHYVFSYQKIWTGIGLFCTGWVTYKMMKK